MTLALNWKAEPQFGGFYEGKFKEEFQKLGLNVEILEGGSGTPTVQMAASGKVDFAVVAGDELLISRDRGSDLVALFAAYQTAPQGLMAHEERGFKSIKDLFESGGTLALQKGLPYSLFLAKKFPNSKVKLVPYAGGIGQFAADKKHSQQCFVTSEPLLAEKQGLKVKTFLIADEGFNPYTTVVVVRRKFFEEKSEVVKKMHAALLKSWTSYVKDPKSTNAKMAEINKAMDLKTLEESANAQKPLVQGKDPIGTMTEERWKSLSEQLYELKLIRSKVENVKSVYFQATDLK
ncbi:MAG: ABC transporter substrate-binding protein [Bdellovibrionales bacterium]|nr:ABC transporter substrate-binding protein [Bdellovibrionales bacterium]